jgi:uncharacterized protein (UPF0261 family)
MGRVPFFTPGGPLHDALGYKAFLKALRNHLHARIQLKEVDAHIPISMMGFSSISVLTN